MKHTVKSDLKRNESSDQYYDQISPKRYAGTRRDAELQDIVDVSRPSLASLLVFIGIAHWQVLNNIQNVSLHFNSDVCLILGLRRRLYATYQTNSTVSRKTCALDVIGSSARPLQIYTRCAVMGEVDIQCHQLDTHEHISIIGSAISMP